LDRANSSQQKTLANENNEISKSLTINYQEAQHMFEVFSTTSKNENVLKKKKLKNFFFKNAHKKIKHQYFKTICQSCCGNFTKNKAAININRVRT
jgi:hypothetical protein